MIPSNNGRKCSQLWFEDGGKRSLPSETHSTSQSQDLASRPQVVSTAAVASASVALDETDQYALSVISYEARKLVRKHIISADDEHDRAQDMFLAYMRSKAHFDPTRGSYRTFVAAVVRNAALSIARKVLHDAFLARNAPTDVFATEEGEDPGLAGRQHCPLGRLELSVAVSNVLSRQPENLRALASQLTILNPAEISRRTGRSRMAIYKDLRRLQEALVQGVFTGTFETQPEGEGDEPQS